MRLQKIKKDHIIIYKIIHCIKIYPKKKKKKEFNIEDSIFMKYKDIDKIMVYKLNFKISFLN